MLKNAGRITDPSREDPGLLRENPALSHFLCDMQGSACRFSKTEEDIPGKASQSLTRSIMLLRAPFIKDGWENIRLSED